MDEKNYWLSRIAWEGRITYALLEKGYLPIGFADFSTPDFIAAVRGENGEEALNKEMRGNGDALPRNRWFLYHFIAEMQAGDYVLVPKPSVFDVYRIENDEVLSIEEMADVWKDIRLWGDDTVYIGEDGYLYTGNDDDLVDVGLFRKVTPVMLDIPREEYASAGLISRMKYRGTNANISDLAADIQDAIRRYEQQQPINIHNEILEACKPSVLEKLCSLSSADKFERVVEQYFRTIGANNVEIPAKNSDKEGCADADVVATFEHLRTIVYVQVKHHDKQSNTDDWAVQQIKEWKEQKGNINDYTTAAWVISTATFTPQTKEAAAGENVLLVSGEEFAQMLLEAGFKDIQ